MEKKIEQEHLTLDLPVMANIDGDEICIALGNFWMAANLEHLEKSSTLKVDREKSGINSKIQATSLLPSTEKIPARWKMVKFMGNEFLPVVCYGE